MAKREVWVAHLRDLSDDEARSFDLEGTEIVLCRVDGEVYALQGNCTHEELPLDGGEVEDGILTCNWHGATFDVRTGAVRSLPALQSLRTWETLVREGGVYVLIDDPQGG